MDDLPVKCPVSGENIAILVAAGQSNLASNVIGDYLPKENVILFNPYNGKCYKQSKLSKASSVAIRIAEKLSEQGPYDTVVLANFSRGGSDIKLWKPGKQLFQHLEKGIALLSRMKLSPTHLIWELGETDTNFQTPPDEFRAHTNEFFDGIRRIGYKGPIYVAKSTRCLMAPGMMPISVCQSADKIRAVQGDVVNAAKGILAGPDTDIIQGNGRDWIQCHFVPSGANLAAQLWVDSILGSPKEKLQGSIHIDRDVQTTWNHAWHRVATMQFHPWISDHEIEGSNNFVAHRKETFITGGRLEENIVTYDYGQRLLETQSTNIVGPSLPVRRLWTHIKVKPDDKKGSVFEWTLIYDANHQTNPSIVAKKVKAFLDAGLIGLKKAVEEASQPQGK